MCTLEKRGKLFILTLKGDTKEDRQHLINPTLISSIRAALAQAKSQAIDGSVLVTVSEGKYFSNGFDLRHAQAVGVKTGSPGAEHAELPRLVDLSRGVVADLLSLPMPTIAAVTGHAAGSGVLFAMCHDYVLMTSSRGVLYMSELNLGMTLPDFAVALIKTKIGSAAARRELVLRAEKIGSKAAVGMGIVESDYDTAEEVVAAAVRKAEELGKRQWRGEAYAGNRKALHKEVCELVGLKVEGVMASRL